ncbi:transposase [Paenibacillus sp. A3M_27_13]|nr:transposase [Paenibacillus sp. A3M_27_13]
MLKAMLWVARTGATWRDMTGYYPSWSSVNTRFRHWKTVGIWNRILELISIEPDFESVMIDVTIVCVHQHGLGQKGVVYPGHRKAPRQTNHF